MIFTSKDGELRLYDGNSGGSGPYYLKILFTQADLSFPLNRGKPEEILNMNRGNMDTNASYSQGPDNPIVDPLPVKFSGKIDDTIFTHRLIRILSGQTKVSSGTTTASCTLTTTKASTALKVGGAAVTTKAFADSSKTAYNVEIKYDGVTDFIYRLREVYFPPDQQVITEGEDGVKLDVNGLWFGSGGTASTFTTGKNLATAAAT